MKSLKVNFDRNRVIHAVAYFVSFVVIVLSSGLSRDVVLSQTNGRLEIVSLSSRPDLVSGGDTLILIKAPAGIQLGRLSLTLNGKDVTSQLRQDPKTGDHRGLISGLKTGENWLRVTAEPSKAQASLKLINHPITGPVLSGPHLSPYECRTVESGMGEPLDADCSARQKIDYFYRSTDKTFKPLANPTGRRPADLAATTTNDGKTVPYIVRVDSGTINRTIYRIAILDDPKSSEAAVSWAPGPGWNRKLAVGFGGGAGTQYNQGVNQATNALNDLYLSRGFAFMISTELVNQLHGNAVLQGETLMMLKEYFIERYDVPKWTVGHGGSGGAIQQLVITQIYPGLLDGLQPTASFPDSSLHTADCGLLQNFWRRADPAVWTDAKRTAVEGYTKGTCAAWERSFVPVLTATNARGCAMSDSSRIYDPKKNPKGARCTMQEMRANIYGRDPVTGFARKPQDNIGLQYGLEALNIGAINIDEFLELNEKLGGNDIDGNFVPERSSGDLIAIKALYRSGLINSGGGGLANVPILHARSYTDAAGDIHDRQRDLTIRARLQRANGRHDNQVIWVGPPRQRGQTGGVDMASLSIDTINKWLDDIAADPAPLSTAKVVRHKPAEATDACWDQSGTRIIEKDGFTGRGKCNELYPVHSEPRLAAGAPLTNDISKCQLKPINFADYKVRFSDTQKTRMKAVFPSGVCDFSKPGIGQGPIKGKYQRY
ncbi:MAG: hypothetical protein IPM55_21990 [Acidobacteria bacterium]|nr:hypothetical protein [Acidobacteriota bacterium]